MSYEGKNPFKVPRAFMQVGGVATSTLSAALTLTLASSQMQKLDPGGANRDVTLPAEEGNDGLWYELYNAADAAENLVVKDDAAATIITINRGEFAKVACTGTAWVVVAATGVAGSDFGAVGISTDVVAESTSGSGVTVDGLLIKDGYVVAIDSQGVKLGTGVDDTISHDGTLTTWTHTTGDLVIDNTDVNDQIILRVGTDTSATGVEFRNDSDVAIFKVEPSGASTGNATLLGQLTATGIVNGSTLDQNATIDQDTADTAGTGAALDSLGTSTSATGSYAIIKGTFQQLTNAKTAGVGFGVQGTYVGLAGDTSGAIVGGLYAAAPTLNGGSATDAGLAIAAGYTNDIYFVDTSAVITVQDAAAAALTIKDAGGNNFLVVDTAAVDGITLGNATTNPVLTVLGTGGTDVSAGTLTVGAANVSGVVTLADGASLLLKGAGTGTGDVIEAVGATATEAFRLVVYDATVSPSAVETNLINLPAGSMIVSVQGNVQTALTGGGTTVTWSIGTTADPDKYGSAGFNSITGAAASDALTQNSKSTWFGDGSHAMSLSGAAEQLVLTGAATGGTADGNTALTVGSVRVRVLYWQLQALDNA